MDEISYGTLAAILGRHPDTVRSWIEVGVYPRGGHGRLMRLPARRRWHDWTVRMCDWRRWAAQCGIDDPCDSDDLRVVSCARCDADLLVPGQDRLVRRLRMRAYESPLPRPLAGRIQGRPYCSRCLREVARRES